MKITSLTVASAIALFSSTAIANTPVPPLERLTGLSIGELQDGLVLGGLSSEEIVRLYIDRMHAIDDTGHTINAVIALYPDALETARTLDAERAAGHVRGTLHGIPIVIKDNIEADGALATTAGSLALADNVTGRDSPLVARLRNAGAIILGRTNLSEWANFRSNSSTSGWSAMWGLTRNPHSLDRSACGSSSGSGAAVAASLAAAAIGTETDGSIVCPAGTNGIVGFKPTLGLVSRRYIVPISHSQDTAGPMTHNVRDAALILSVIAGTDPQDEATAEADARRSDYAASLSPSGLRGQRIGVMRDRVGNNPAVLALLDQAVAVLRTQGATIVDIADSGIDDDTLGEAEFAVLLTEFKADLNAYLAGIPFRTPRTPITLAQLIAFNRAEPREMQWFGQETFERAEATTGTSDEAYQTALATAQRLAGADGIDRLRLDYHVDLLLGVTNGPAWAIDLVNGDNYGGPGSATLPAVAGYPHLTVPMGAIHGLPIGLSFIGTRWDDARVLNAGYAYEQASHAMVSPAYQAAIAP
ncbi:MAG: amidase [Pseudomonadota bacterium]